jgi:KaiC/GvpD/RAD55 family RecA-like ATPase
VGSTTVVAGISGVGKSVMGLQFIAEGARRDERSLMLSLDEQVNRSSAMPPASASISQNL